VRGEDGRVRVAEDGQSIGEVWAEQRRIRLAEAIDADKLKAQKRKVRKASLKKLGSKPLSLLRLVQQFFKHFLRLSKRRRFVVVGASAALVALLVFVPWLLFRGDNGTDGVNAKGVLSGKIQRPDYSTVLPEGKRIEDLGGWGRVSPPDKDPVFAYADTIAGVHITVSEQRLPSVFRPDVSGSVADLAKSFSATDAVTVDGKTFYIGTSIKGPQSVILAMDDLLILIKSDSGLTDRQWSSYITALK